VRILDIKGLRMPQLLDAAASDLLPSKAFDVDDASCARGDRVFLSLTTIGFSSRAPTELRVRANVVPPRATKSAVKLITRLGDRRRLIKLMNPPSPLRVAGHPPPGTRPAPPRHSNNLANLPHPRRVKHGT
jgi:hypothetical protein